MQASWLPDEVEASPQRERQPVTFMAPHAMLIAVAYRGGADPAVRAAGWTGGSLEERLTRV